MNDRELLELAARAAGYVIRYYDDGTLLILDGKKSRPYWNPIFDPGDALRLAVRLQMTIEIYSCGCTAIAADCSVRWDMFDDKDPMSATCLAITRAAAEVGKGMEP